jgi:hypothetical protein
MENTENTKSQIQIHNKTEKCPICYRQITTKNPWIKFHIKYEPELVIMACKNCNFVEYALRNNLKVPFLLRNPYKPLKPSRAEMVARFLRKFDIIYKLE